MSPGSATGQRHSARQRRCSASGGCTPRAGGPPAHGGTSSAVSVRQPLGRPCPQLAECLTHTPETTPRPQRQSPHPAPQPCPRLLQGSGSVPRRAIPAQGTGPTGARPKCPGLSYSSSHASPLPSSGDVASSPVLAHLRPLMLTRPAVLVRGSAGSGGPPRGSGALGFSGAWRQGEQTASFLPPDFLQGPAWPSYCLQTDSHPGLIQAQGTSRRGFLHSCDHSNTNERLWGTDRTSKLDLHSHFLFFLNFI